MNKLKVLDLFSGIGGFSLGLERTGGFETVAFCEIEEFPRKILKKHWPKVPCYHDVRELTADTLRRDGIEVDVISGGFPCQDVSNANAVWRSQLGLEGSRSGLWGEYFRLIDEIRPSFIIMENVRALLRVGLLRVLGNLASIGFDAEWRVIPGTAVGSLQRRERVWVVAYPSEDRKQGLLEGIDFGRARQRGQGRQADMPMVYAAPFERSSWPEPLICGGNNRPANWVDRIGACGNAVIPQIPELIGRAILESREIAA